MDDKTFDKIVTKAIENCRDQLQESGLTLSDQQLKALALLFHECSRISVNQKPNEPTK